MKITFVRGCPPIIASGNEAYKAGTKADLRKGQELIDLGYARIGWESQEVTYINGTHPLQADAYDISLDGFSDDELKSMAKERGIKGYWNMNRETLIERLVTGYITDGTN